MLLKQNKHRGGQNANLKGRLFGNLILKPRVVDSGLAANPLGACHYGRAGPGVTTAGSKGTAIHSGKGGVAFSWDN